jgi:hypothetical protein
MKTQSKFIGKIVKNPGVTMSSGNKFGIVKDFTLLKYSEKHPMYKCYTVRFRDYEEHWSINQLRKNIVLL